MGMFTRTVSSESSQQLCREDSVCPPTPPPPVTGKIETESHLPKAGGEGVQVESRQLEARGPVHNISRHRLHWGETRKTQDHKQEFTANGNIPFPAMPLTHSLTEYS